MKILRMFEHIYGYLLFVQDYDHLSISTLLPFVYTSMSVLMCR